MTCSEHCDAINYAADQGYVDVAFRELYDEDVHVVINLFGEEQMLLDIGNEKKLMGYSTSIGGVVPLFNSSIRLPSAAGMMRRYTVTCSVNRKGWSL